MSVPRPRRLPAVGLDVVAALAGAPVPPVTDAVAVRGVTLDSRAVEPGDLYAALPGAHVHGAEFATAAVAGGAVAVLTDRPLDLPVPVLVVPDPRAVLGAVAARVYGDPSAALAVVGVTGTNGKTTTSYLLEAGLRHAGHTTALLGTVETRLAGERLDAVRTTPEAPALQALLAVARERGVDAVAMEVSSHALALHRVDGTRFAVGVFTNLSQDHLDFHADMEEYFAAKASLFTRERVARAVVGIDDEWGRRLAAGVDVPTVTFSVGALAGADWSVTDVVADVGGTTAVACGPAGERVALRVALPGAFNLANGLAALAALVALGLDPATAAAGIASAAGVPGRLEPVPADRVHGAFVDYAHTPAAVATLLEVLRPLTPGRLVVVLGAGGDRDRGKRPLMGRAAAAGADLTVLTSDNPRSEDPLAILAALTGGLDEATRARVVVEPDRATAIARAVEGLGPDDVVVVAGKGHETGQEIAGRVLPFDDRVVLAQALRAGTDTALRAGTDTALRAGTPAGHGAPA